MNEVKINNQDNNLPPGWEWHKLDNCIEILDSQRIPINSEEREKRISNKSKAELYPYYGATGQVGWIDDYLFDEELVLLGEDGAPFLESIKDKAYIIKGKSWVNNHAHVLKAISEISSNSFLCHYLNIFDYHGYVSGTTRLKLNQGTMKQIPIPIPPLPEQRLIVKRVDSLLEHVKKAKESLEKIPRILKRFRQAALKKAFSGELTAEWREQQQDLEPAAELLKRVQEGRKPAKRKKSTEINTSDLSDLPNEWCWATLGTVSEIAMGQSPPGESYNFSGNGVPLINGPVEFGPTPFSKTIKAKFTTSPTKMCRENDLIVCVRGSTTGRMNIAGFDACIGRGVAAMRSLINQSYLNLYVHSIEREILELGTGSTFPNVQGEVIGTISIPISPLPEQQEIVRRIESLFKFADETEKKAREASRRVELMTQSILSRAFWGDLTADFREAVRNWKDQDAEARRRYLFVLPEDEQEKVLNADEFPMESASELLGRIREKRAKMERKSSKPRLRGQKQKLPLDSVVTNMN